MEPKNSKALYTSHWSLVKHNVLADHYSQPLGRWEYLETLNVLCYKLLRCYPKLYVDQHKMSTCHDLTSHLNKQDKEPDLFD